MLPGATQANDSQWQAVKDYYKIWVKSSGIRPKDDMILKSFELPSTCNVFKFDDRAVVLVTETDLDGYEPEVEGGQILAELSVIYKARVVGQAALARLSCLWLRCHTQQKIVEEQLCRKGSCTITAEKMSGNLTVDIHVY